MPPSICSIHLFRDELWPRRQRKALPFRVTQRRCFNSLNFEHQEGSRLGPLNKVADGDNYWSCVMNRSSRLSWGCALLSSALG